MVDSPIISCQLLTGSCTTPTLSIFKEEAGDLKRWKRLFSLLAKKKDRSFPRKKELYLDTLLKYDII